ncbi:ribosomal L1 domain-containing protein 1-like isoform X6 [Oncorhynchus keta]|uniref:ribosomal L1 domain-containing protein 1-like isoform X1 n=1 Tax=Oncorhynchus keta TaxID=8018 RepID=UPI00227BC590|nr:ribosomal L1 domain-containing protein 1-like isoform X1 [Oncorhynchus keta]XP_052334038.1 ribosomal L1 domain-containing protein 1-like isoform X2 [Oncorhynchus keta]XP_052334039.1 ribosomal L1 domain-containing protein 1-like isoform X3 [Oncorhynchus keta]XP_052334041.1 ribosomal L1 domain-containing protein 1-like isoform X4 [Oncorhynchus keta]XP_052334042.1 ribosomal L1 domain-containing protein 1-like isoform X5 [Oncorhynchus keta]XP_052334043.1 ribosomal L1 domain-containing protein 1
MRNLEKREERSMADKHEDLPLDRVQKRKALQAFLKTKSTPDSAPGRESTPLPLHTMADPQADPDHPRVIPYKTLRTEYKPFEDKRRLLGNFDMFLSDDRIRRLLSSHIGKHFYERKKEPLSLNLQSKKLALDIQRTIQGTTTSISMKGCYCMAYVAHSGMAADEIAENIDSAVSTIVPKLRVRKDR